MKKEINQIKFTNQWEKNYNYSRNEVLNKINEIKLKAANNHGKNGGKLVTLRKSETKVTLILAQNFFFHFFSVLKEVNYR